MATGTLFDAQDNILLDNCTLEEALAWLRAFNPCGWHGGNTIWLPDESAVIIADANHNFEHPPRHHAPLPTNLDSSPHFPV